MWHVSKKFEKNVKKLTLGTERVNTYHRISNDDVRLKANKQLPGTNNIFLRLRSTVWFGDWFRIYR